MHPEPQYDYKILASELIKRLLIILGPDITIQTARSIHEVQLSPDGQISTIAGDAQIAFEKLVSEFRELSAFTVERVLHELHVEHEKRGSGPAGVGMSDLKVG